MRSDGMNASDIPAAAIRDAGRTSTVKLPSGWTSDSSTVPAALMGTAAIAVAGAVLATVLLRAGRPTAAEDAASAIESGELIAA